MFNECQICFEKYNEEKKLPRLFPVCGHTVCSECLSKMLSPVSSQQLPSVKCPFCRRDQGASYTSLQAFPVNQDLKSKVNYYIFDKFEKAPVCSTHNKQAYYLCVSEPYFGMNVCETCIEEILLRLPQTLFYEFKRNTDSIVYEDYQKSLDDLKKICTEFVNTILTKVQRNFRLLTNKLISSIESAYVQRENINVWEGRCDYSKLYHFHDSETNMILLRPKNLCLINKAQSLLKNGSDLYEKLLGELKSTFAKHIKTMNEQISHDDNYNSALGYLERFQDEWVLDKRGRQKIKKLNSRKRYWL